MLTDEIKPPNNALTLDRNFKVLRAGLVVLPIELISSLAEKHFMLTPTPEQIGLPSTRETA